MFIILHLVGLAIGFGGALVSDYLFFRFLKDLKLSKKELEVMDYLSKFVWIGLLLLIISGALIFLSNPTGYMESSKFLIKMFIVLMITLNGFFLHFYVKPRLKLIDWKAGLKDSHRGIRKIAFASGSVSVTSWSLATVLGSLSSIPLSFLQSFVIYAIIILVAISVSQLMEYLFSKHIDAIT